MKEQTSFVRLSFKKKKSLVNHRAWVSEEFIRKFLSLQKSIWVIKKTNGGMKNSSRISEAVNKIELFETMHKTEQLKALILLGLVIVKV